MTDDVDGEKLRAMEENVANNVANDAVEFQEETRGFYLIRYSVRNRR
jgi:hypothetical protein